MVLACSVLSQNGKRMAGEEALRSYLDKWDRKYWATYKVLDILQKVFYRSNPAREAFVELCEDSYVQKMTFDSYLYKVRGEASVAPVEAHHPHAFSIATDVMLVTMMDSLQWSGPLPHAS
jgi:hypothetical protein